MRKTASVLCKSLVGPTTTFQLSEERQKQKNYAHVYRRDTDVFLPDFFCKGVGVCKQARGPPL